MTLMTLMTMVSEIHPHTRIGGHRHTGIYLYIFIVIIVIYTYNYRNMCELRDDDGLLGEQLSRMPPPGIKAN